MEYGPRALGNRTVFASCSDPTINKWLNDRLHRTEFMPFAPVTLWEARHQCYENCSGAEHAAQFMTITFDCTDYMKKTSPAAVHIDGTIELCAWVPQKPEVPPMDVDDLLHGRRSLDHRARHDR